MNSYKLYSYIDNITMTSLQRSGILSGHGPIGTSEMFKYQKSCIQLSFLPTFAYGGGVVGMTSMQ